MTTSFLRSLSELEVIVDSIVIKGNKAIVNFNSGKSRYYLEMNRKKAEKFEFNKKYTAFMDYKLPFINGKELEAEGYKQKDKYREALRRLQESKRVKRYIHSIRDGNQNFIYP